MGTEVTTHERCYVMGVAGRIDSAAAHDLETEFKTRMQEHGYNIVFNMAAVDFLSSKGWWVLMAVQKTCKKQGGELVLAEADKHILSSLALLGIDDYFRVFDTLTKAVANF